MSASRFLPWLRRRLALRPRSDLARGRQRPSHLGLGVLLVVTGWLGLPAAAPAPAPDAPPPPPARRDPPRLNLVLLLADDLGCEEVGVYGGKAVRTPHIDRLAHEGLRFDAAFVTASSCSPSRCSIITGRYPHATGAAWLHQPLPREQVTFVERLRAAGYWTAAAGKWHLGPEVRDRFDVIHEGDRTVDGQKGDGSGCTWWEPTIAERPRDRPFFLWLASIDPHRPYFRDAIPTPHDPAQAAVPPYLPDHPDTRADLAESCREVWDWDLSSPYQPLIALNQSENIAGGWSMG